MVKTIYNGEYEKKAITDQFVENLGEMLEKDTVVEIERIEGVKLIVKKKG